MTQKELLTALHKLGAKITGSYARGDQRDISDLDIFVAENDWPLAKKLMLESGFAIVSTALGQLATKETTPWFEVSYRFDRQPAKCRFKTVVIDGLKFKTH